MHQVEQRVEGFFTEFWKFAAKGNAMQLAVAVVLGTAFGAIVNSLVNDIIMPFIGLATNDVDFSAWAVTIRQPTVINGTTTPALVIGYGHLIQASVNFFVIGISIFVIFKLFSGVSRRVRRKEQAEPPVPVSTQEKLLGEIRDLLKAQKEEKPAPNQSL